MALQFRLSTHELNRFRIESRIVGFTNAILLLERGLRQPIGEYQLSENEQLFQPIVEPINDGWRFSWPTNGALDEVSPGHCVGT